MAANLDIGPVSALATERAQVAQSILEGMELLPAGARDILRRVAEGAATQPLGTTDFCPFCCRTIANGMGHSITCEVVRSNGMLTDDAIQNARLRAQIMANPLPVAEYLRTATAEPETPATLHPGTLSELRRELDRLWTSESVTKGWCDKFHARLKSAAAGNQSDVKWANNWYEQLKKDRRPARAART